MANFAKKLEEATEKELYSWVNELDFNVVPLASDELTRRVLNKLRETIQVFNEQSSKQTQKMIRLTRRIFILTVVMIFGLAVQIIFAIPTKSICNGGSNDDGLSYTYTCTTNIGLGLFGNYSFEKQIIRDTPLLP